MKKLIAILTVALLLAGITVSAYAQETPVPIMEGAQPAQPVDSAESSTPVEEVFSDGVNAVADYEQLKIAYNEILEFAKTDNNILAVAISPDSTIVLVAIAEGYEKEYAQRFIREYGSFVVVTNDVDAAANAAPAGGLEGGSKNNLFGIWVFPTLIILLLGTATIIFLNRTRPIPAMQTNSGNIATGNAPVSRKQTIAAIKDSAITPSDDMFDLIMDKIEKAQKKALGNPEI